MDARGVRATRGRGGDFGRAERDGGGGGGDGERGRRRRARVLDDERATGDRLREEDLVRALPEAGDAGKEPVRVGELRGPVALVQFLERVVDALD